MNFRGFAFSIWMLISAPLLAHSLPIDQKSFYLANDEIDVKSYQISMTVDRIAADAKITVRERISLLTLKDISSLKLHATESAIVVKKATINYNPVQVRFLKGYVLEFQRALLKGKTTTVDVVYEITTAQLNNSEQHGLFFSEPGTINVENWPYYTRTWIISNDAPTDLASFELFVNVPQGTQVANNGILISEKIVQTRSVFHWKMNSQIPTYGINLVIGDYQKFQRTITELNLPLEIYLKKSPLESETHDKLENIQSSIDAVTFFSTILGAYPFEKVGFIEAPQHFNMEYPGLITGLDANVHEIAHHWFGDSVTIKSWGDLWISEGFTTYLDGLYQEYFQLDSHEWLLNRDGVFNFSADTDPNAIFNDLPYHTGASSVHALRTTLRDACHFTEKSPEDYTLTFSILKSIYQKFKGRSLGTAELVNYISKNASAIAKNANCQLEKKQASQLIRSWADAWYEL